MIENSKKLNEQVIYINMDDSGILVKNEPNELIFVYGGVFFMSLEEQDNFSRYPPLCFSRRRIFIVLRPEARADKGYLPAEFILAVVAVAGAFLRIACNAVTDYLMGHASVADKADGYLLMLQHGFMTAF